MLLFAFIVVVAMTQNDKKSRPSWACLRDPLRVNIQGLWCVHREQARSHKYGVTPVGASLLRAAIRRWRQPGQRKAKSPCTNGSSSRPLTAFTVSIIGA